MLYEVRPWRNIGGKKVEFGLSRVWDPKYSWEDSPIGR